MKKSRQKCELEAFICRSFDFLPQFIVSEMKLVHSRHKNLLSISMLYRRSQYQRETSSKKELQEAVCFKLTNGDRLMLTIIFLFSIEKSIIRFETTKNVELLVSRTHLGKMEGGVKKKEDQFNFK